MIYSKLIRPLVNGTFSFIMNLFYWAIHINKLPEAKARKKDLETNPPKDISDIYNIMMKYTWKEDTFPRWTPWTITIISHFELKDKCRGAAYLGKWLLSKQGIPSSIHTLRGKRKTKLICISNDHKIMIFDNITYSFQTKKIKREIYTLFNEAYDTLDGRSLVEKKNGIIVG